NGMTDMLEIQHVGDGTAVATEWIAAQNGYTQGPSTVLGKWVAGTLYQFGQTSAGTGNALIEIQNVNGQTVATRWVVGATGLTQEDQTTLGVWSASNAFQYGDVTGTGELDLMEVAPTGTESVTVTRWIAGATGAGFAQGASLNLTDTSGGGGFISPIALQDVSGTGYLSLVIPWTVSGNYYLFDQVNVGNAGTLTSVSSGLNRWNYVGSTISTVYAQFSLSNDPNTNGKGMGFVFENTSGKVSFNTVIPSTGAMISVSLGTPQLNQQFLAGDVTGNGCSDLVQIWENGQGQAVASVWYSNAQGTAYTQGATTVLGVWQPGATYQLADANGDGRADIVASWIAANGSAVVSTWYSTGTGFSQNGNWIADTQAVMGNFTGNGMTDMLEIRHAADGTAIATEWIATQSGYTQGPSTVLGQWVVGMQYQFGQTSAGTGNSLVVIQDLNGQTVATRWTVGATGLTKSDQTTLGRWSVNNSFQYGDVTGTGELDLMEVSSTGADSVTVTRWIAGATGAGFTQGASLNLTDTSGGGGFLSPIALQDVSGTGHLSLVIPWTVSGNYYLFDQVNVGSAGTLTSVSSGLNRWNYVGSTISTVYAQFSLSNDPNTSGKGMGFVFENTSGKVSFNTVIPSTGAMISVSLGTPQLNQQFLAGDVDGNGRTDLVQIWENAQGLAVASVWYSNAQGSAYTQGANTVLGAWQAGATYQLANVSSDGRAAIVATSIAANGSLNISTWYSTGSGFGQNGNLSADTQTVMGNFTGNGMADMLEIQHAADDTAIATEWIATQSGYTQGSSTVLGQWVAGTQYQFGQTSAGIGNALVVLQDVNGQTVATRWVVDASGLTQEDQTTLGIWSANNTFQYGDLTGTGELDLMEVAPTGTESVTVTRWIAGATGSGFTQGVSLNLTDPEGGNGGFIFPIALQDVGGTGYLSLVIPWTYSTSYYSFDQVSVSSTGALAAVSSGLTGLRSTSATISTVYAQFNLSNDPNTAGKGMGIVYENTSGTVSFEALIPSTGAMISVSLGTPQLNQQFLAGDVTGNGRSDLVQIWENSQGQAVASVWYSNTQGTAYTQGATTVLGAWQPSTAYQLANANGDGRAAIVATSIAANGSLNISAWYSTGSGFSQNGNWSADTQTVMGNFTGNGMTDMLEIQHVGDGTAVATEWIA
ncbi:beta strand repeat-containing protein, partial [Solimicrobium silvestre]|uniref:beta strand repeat-containing protein n=1 Tax=Solimicrobium silvestre TaxID=2099400 RepID=UPI0013FE4A5D